MYGLSEGHCMLTTREKANEATEPGSLGFALSSLRDSAYAAKTITPKPKSRADVSLPPASTKRILTTKRSTDFEDSARNLC